MENDNSIVRRLIRFVRAAFKTNLEIFLEALKLSPNAQGYISGSITELLLKKKLEEEYGMEVGRIKEKWEGEKHPNHRGDFYFGKCNTPMWYVIESKGVKSNTEKWHRLYNYDNLKRFMLGESDKIPWVNRDDAIEPQIEAWIAANLPKFKVEHASNMYLYEEVQSYLRNPPKRATEKSNAIVDLQDLSREQINQVIDERLTYLMSRMKVLETHFVSGTSRISHRTQATPRSDEFNVVAVDIVLRYPEHRFLFANPKLLEPSGDDPDHLQQNYVMGFVFQDGQGNQVLSVTQDWYEDLNEVYETLNPRDCVREEDMQVDRRVMILDHDSETE